MITIKSPFPSFVGFAILEHKDLDISAVSPAELRTLGEGAREKRRGEFILGRMASRRALHLAGLSDPQPVLRGRFNEPLWPRGYLGSISHSSSMAVAVACNADHAGGIGVDIEDLEERVEPQVYELACTDSELRWIHENDDLAPERFRRLFSAKEAAYKAFFPRVGSYIDFKDAELAWIEKEGRFMGRVLKDICPSVRRDLVFHVGSTLSGNLIMSHMLLDK